jgi:hypothetical protein
MGGDDQYMMGRPSLNRPMGGANCRSEEDIAWREPMLLRAGTTTTDRAGKIGVETLKNDSRISKHLAIPDLEH